MVTGARDAALKALASFRKNGAWSEQVMDSLIKTGELDERDAALASRIFYGTLQNLYRCDYYIQCYSAIGLSKIEPMVRDILRISAYQLAFMDKIPAHSVVDEAVKLAKKRANIRAAGFVNAVLRKIADNKDALPEVCGETKISRLSVMYSHPQWLVERLCKRLGVEGCEKLLRMNNMPSQFTIQVNTLKTDAHKLKAELEAEGRSCELFDNVPNCMTVSPAGRLYELGAFQKGEFYVQDPAAKLAVMALKPQSGMNVIDVCAAPGGKSFAAAMMMENRGHILSCDIHEKKLGLIEEGRFRLGIDIIYTQKADASKPSEELISSADAVIADVPCSGFGIIRKKPEIRYKDEESIKNLPEVQYKILENVSRYVKKGGVLVYSTCTVFKEENEDVVTKFLSQNREFVPEKFTLPIENGDAPDGMITLWPHINGTDGFFVCRMRKV